eukprot:scaffold28617_cov66-Skeletonema_marinoi.AAC.1
MVVMVVVVCDHPYHRGKGATRENRKNACLPSGFSLLPCCPVPVVGVVCDGFLKIDIERVEVSWLWS